MRLIETGSFLIADIEIGDRLRAINPSWVRAIAETIRSSGLQHPVELVKIGNRYQLVAGAHRIEAFKSLGLADIPARVMETETERPDLEIREHEIIENVARHELTAIDRACHLAELKRVHLELYPDAGHGGDRKSLKNRREIKSPFWRLDQADMDGVRLSERSVQRSIQIFDGLSAENRKRVVGTRLANHQAQLKQLSGVGHSQQRLVLELMLRAEDPVTTVATALAIIEKRPKAKTDHDKTYVRLTKLWLSAPKKVQGHFIEFLRSQGAIGPGAE